MSNRLDETGVVENCKPLIEEARAKGMYLFETTNLLFVSPDALLRLQREGRFRWDAENWKLVTVEYARREGSGYDQ